MEAELEFYYDHGIPVYSGLMEKMIKNKVLLKKGSYLTFNGSSDSADTFYAKDFDEFMARHQELLDFSTWEQYKNSIVAEEQLDQ